MQDSTVAILMGVLLFRVPVSVQDRTFFLDHTWYREVSWHVLLFFGGGFALANGFRATGLSRWIGGHLSMVGGVALLMTFLTEVTSNPAMATGVVLCLAQVVFGLGGDVPAWAREEPRDMVS